MRSPLDVLYNFHWIVPGEAARSAQSHFGFLASLLSANGIKAVVNLRGPHPKWRWWQYETRVCRKNGIAHFDTSLDSRKLPERWVLASLFDAFDAAPRPFLVKCSGGQDRTSFAAALYVVHRKGWDALDDAYVQFARFPYLHFPKRDQGWLRHFLKYAKIQAQGAPIASWVRTKYEPTELATWLEANGLSDSFNGLLKIPAEIRDYNANSRRLPRC